MNKKTSKRDHRYERKKRRLLTKIRKDYSCLDFHCSSDTYFCIRVYFIRNLKGVTAFFCFGHILLKTRNILLNNHCFGLAHLWVQFTNKLWTLPTRNPELAVHREYVVMYEFTHTRCLTKIYELQNTILETPHPFPRTLAFQAPHSMW